MNSEQEKPNKEEFREKLQHKIAGETISWKAYERFNIGALPKTLSTLMKAKKAEAYMEATQDKFLTPRQKIALITIVTIMIIVFIGFYLLKSLGMEF